MTDDRFEELLNQMRDEHNAPPPTPRDEIWQKLQVAQGARPTRRTTLLRPVFWWPVAAAALLLLGIGLGRWSKVGEPTTSEVVESTPEAPHQVDPYAVVAARHLNRAETLLTHFESGTAPAISRTQLSSWARALLNDTRLLMDSPAMDEPTTRELLSDVELLLALIVRLDANDTPEAIADGLRNSGLLDRLRSRIPAEPV